MDGTKKKNKYQDGGNCTKCKWTKDSNLKAENVRLHRKARPGSVASARMTI